MIQYNKKELIQFIEENKQLILDRDFDELYSIFRVDHFDNELTQFLVDCGVNPLDFCYELPYEMFRNVELPDQFKELKFRDSVKSIGYGAFLGCSGLESIDFNCVESIGNDAFLNCRGLTSVDLKNVTSIDNGAFSYCTELTSIDLKNVESIGEHAFQYCERLTSIDLKNVTSIGLRVFNGCEGLKKVYAPEGLDLSKAGLPKDCKIIRR